MPTFISLMNWTDQGIRQFPDTLRRAEAFDQQLEQFGGRLKACYWTVGSYDSVAIIEAPDTESATAALLALGALGNVRTETLRAFSREEMQGVIDLAMPTEES
ncbi:MAG: GYD domain-containing protein [Nitriliruptorales bacterium]